MQRTPFDSRDTRDLPLVNGLNQELQILERGRRHDPVPEVEDVTWPSSGSTQDVAGALAHKLWRAKQNGRVEVPLDAAVMTDPVPSGVQRHAPVKRHDVRSSG